MGVNEGKDGLVSNAAYAAIIRYCDGLQHDNDRS